MAAEMQKVADPADISVLFFQLVLIFEKATCKIIQALVPAAPVVIIKNTKVTIISQRHKKLAPKNGPKIDPKWPKNQHQLKK